MTIYTVLEPPDARPERVAFVADGFAFGALAFTFLWALWQRMWVVAAVLFAVSSTLTVATNLDLLGPGLATFLQAGIALLFAFEARALQVLSLERAGYRCTGLLQASNRDAAEVAYFASRSVSAPAFSRLRSLQDDTLGIFGNV